MSQNESTMFLVTDAKNLTLIDATRENSPWCLEIFAFAAVDDAWFDPMDDSDMEGEHLVWVHSWVFWNFVGWNLYLSQLELRLVLLN